MSEVNGCGGKGSIIPVPQFIFKADCNLHDISYGEGGTEKDRIRADTGFLRYMLIDCECYSGIYKYFYKLWAYIYYFAVRLFGKKYFNYK